MDYEQKFGDLVLMYGVEVCFKCNCRTGSYDLGHSRSHAHIEERKICLANVPTSYGRFLTALHEIGHLQALRGGYTGKHLRAEAEHNATQWAYQEMRKLGLPIKRKYKAKYSAYIRNKIDRALRRGLNPKRIPLCLKKY